MKAGKKHINRRDFLSTAAASAAAFSVVPGSVLSGAGTTPPSERINLACIGVGGQGIVDMKNLIKFPDIQVMTVCDPNEISDYSMFYFGGTGGRKPAREIAEKYYAENKSSGSYKGVDAYVDYREMLDARKDIDAVSIATTDNLHAPAAMAAMKKGLHVYGEKPLTHSVYESRVMGEAARKYKVATQMGNHGQASEETRLICEWIWADIIGPVREVHAWTDRAGYRWAQGIPRPEDKPPVPDTLDWDKWIGPAQYRPYNPAYLPFKWRGWVDFGTGALGDMGCHILDAIFRAFKLEYPTSVEAESTPFNNDSFPLASTMRYEFPARGDLPALTLYWYDGGRKPPRPNELGHGRQLSDAGGVIYVGEKGKLYNGRLIPESKMKTTKHPSKTLPRSIGHYKEWVEACKGGAPAGSRFEFASVVTETVLLGNVVLRAGKKIEWDGKNFKITNDQAANKLLHRDYRPGWTL